MARQQRKPEQQTKKIGEDHPFVVQMREQTGNAAARLEPGKGQLVRGDDGEPGQADPERVMVEQRDAEERQREEDEIDRDARERRAVGRPGRRRRRQRDCAGQAGP